MCSRSYKTVAAVTLLILSTQLLDQGNAEAQGLLRRLRGRIQSRIVPPPDSAQPADPSQRASGDPAVPPTQVLPPPNLPRGQRVTPRARIPSRGRADYGGSILAPREPDGNRPASRTPSPATLGIEVLPASGAARGVQVTTIGDDSMADEAGLRIDDVIVAVDGVPTPTIADVAQRLRGKIPGDRVQATILRGQSQIELTIPLVGRPTAVASPPAGSRLRALRPPNSPPTTAYGSDSGSLGQPGVPSDQAAQSSSRKRLGIRVKDADPLRGVIVEEVIAGSPAAVAGLQSGDRIVAFEGKLIGDAAALTNQMALLKPDSAIKIQLVRGDSLVNTELDLAAKTEDAAETEDNLAESGRDKASRAGGDSGSSALSGIGSVLGGLFGGNQTPQADPPSTQNVQPQQPDAVEKTDGSDQREGASTIEAAPVQQAGFEDAADLPRPRSGARRADDPPSLDILDMPRLNEFPGVIEVKSLMQGEPAEATAPEPNDDDASRQRRAAELRREIERLQAELRKLEGNESDSSDDPK